jgi:hypothetical protein
MNTETLLRFGKGSNNAKLRKLEEKLGRKVYTFRFQLATHALVLTSA